MAEQFDKCMLCPRRCCADRRGGKPGYCGVDARVRLARAALHMWEEPCISGVEGSGAVFFSGCPMHCVYCQNQEIANGRGWEVSVGRLAEIFLELQEKKANNINLVTPTHYTPQIAEAICMAKNMGLGIPVVYNCSGYESVDTLRMLDGLVDIYLTDFKYPDAEGAARYSKAPDYPQVAMEALEEMVRQCPNPIFAEDTLIKEVHPEKTVVQGKTEDYLEETAGQESREEQMSVAEIPGRMSDIINMAENDEASGEDQNKRMPMMKKGVIVRHLLLPGRVKQACQVVQEIYQRFGDQVYFSLMNQYTPFAYVKEKYPEIGRNVTGREYDRWIDFVLELGVEQAFIQEGDTAEESFIPAFTGEGLFR